MKLDILRIKRILEDLEQLIYVQRIPIEHFRILDDKRLDGYQLDISTWRSFKTDENWLAKGAHRWFRTQVKVPAEFKGKRVVFQLTTGREGQWDACNPQFLFYVDQKLIQGCDVNHREVILTDVASGHEVFDIAFLAYGGTEGEDLLIKCHLSALDVETEGLYYDLKIPAETAELIYDKDAYNRIKIINALDPVVDVLDLRNPYSQTYYDSVATSRRSLKKAFYSEVQEQPVVYAVGNTHIDIAWLWTVEQTREKVLRSYATVIELMDRYPDYKFIGSQAILYQFVKEQKPELYDKIKAKVKAGQWEVDGGMWLEADCNIPSGESLVRQFLKGEQFFEREFGVRSKTLWLPDVFGYSAALPQILKQLDMPYFVTTKLAWNQYNQLPNDVFKWRGLDGSEVFTFMPTTTDYNKHLGNNISFTDTRNTTTYTGILGPNMTIGTYERFQNKNLTEDTMMLYGYGDGGGGPTREMLENEKRLKYGLPGIPRIQTAFNRTYMDKTYDALKDCPSTPTWDGELYFEYHRGTLTSKGSVKRWNRLLEIQMRKLEMLTVMTYLQQDIEIPRKALDSVWDVLLLNQFHDIIPGTSISEVYERTEEEYKMAYKEVQRLLKDHLVHLAQPQVQVFNDQPFPVTNKVEISVDRTDIISANGSPVQYLDDKTILLVVKDVPALATQTIEFEYGQASLTIPESLEAFEFENDYYKIRINSLGQIQSLIEQSMGYEYFNQVGNQVIAYEDRPANWDNWDVDLFYRRKPYYPSVKGQLTLIEKGPVRWTLVSEYTIGQSTINQKIHLYKALPRIEIYHDVDWQEHNLLLRSEFPTTIYQNKATFDIQFGSVERETTSNHTWDLAKFETCGHKWMDYGNRSVGLSLLSDCKYGFSAKEGVMGLSLIKSGQYPNKDGDIGRHYYGYALYPHKSVWANAETIEQAEQFNAPLTFVEPQDRVQAPSKPLFGISEGSIYMDTIKLSEDGDRIILRMHENKNTFCHIKLQVSSLLRDPHLVNLREEVIEAIDMSDQTLDLTFKPFEIKTIAFRKA